VLKKQAHNKAQSAGKETEFGETLLQVASIKNVPTETKRAIFSFLSLMQPAQDEVQGAPEAAGYEFQSQGVIDMLEKLDEKFHAERTTLENEERNSKQAYDLLMQDLKAQLTQAKADRDTKSEVKAKKLQAKATAEGDLKDTTIAMHADQKYLADLEATCAKKAADFEARQQLRAEEIQAIEKAIEIITTRVAGKADGKQLPTLLQDQVPSLAQIKSETQRGRQTRVAAFLRQKAEQLHSRVLAAAAVHMNDDPFGKVKKMIKELVVRLMEEAAEEADHKGWCDEELATNEATRNDKTEAVEVLHAEIDGLEASIAKLEEDLKDLAEAIATLNTNMKKATELRQKEKAENEATIKYPRKPRQQLRKRWPF